MKKGLTIALLMVAMVALAASASAVAPVIGNLPAVIIGDAGDVSGVATEATSLHLLRYVNVFNLANPGVIDRLNKNSISQLKVFYTSSNPYLKVSNRTSLIDAMDAGEVAALTGPGTTTTAKSITAGDSTKTWLSLIQNPSTAAVPASVLAANAPEHGSTVQQFIDGGILDAPGGGSTPITSGTAVVTLYAADGPTTGPSGSLVSKKDFVVYSVIGTADNFSPIDRVYASALTPGADPVDGWEYRNLTAAYGGTSPLQAGVKITTTAGIGFRGVASFGANKNQAFSSWQHMNNAGDFSRVLASAKDMDGKIYRATIKLTGDAAQPSLCPAYRFLYTSMMFTHVGGFQVNTPPSGDGIPEVAAGNMPNNGGEVELQMLWAVPTDMVGYSDTGILTTLSSGKDYRDYFIYFDLMQVDAGDVGSLVMESLNVDRIVRPADASSETSQWGTVTRNFTTTVGLNFDGSTEGDTAGPWLIGPTDLGTGDGIGTVQITPTVVSMSMSTTKPNVSSVFQQVAANPNATVFPKWESGKLIRTTYNLACTNGAGCPQIRALVIPYVKPFFAIGNVLWADLVNPYALARDGRYTPSKYAYLAGSPKTTGSVFESYAYTQAGIEPLSDPANMSSALTTAIDINVAQGSWSAATNFGWSKPNARIDIKGLSIEVLK